MGSLTRAFARGVGDGESGRGNPTVFREARAEGDEAYRFGYGGLAQSRRWAEKRVVRNRLSLLDVIEKFLGHDVADAVGGAALTGVFAIFFEGVAVVKGDFLAGGNVAAGDDPDATVLVFGFAVGRATVIEKSGGVFFGVAVEIELIVQGEDESIAEFAASEGFGLGDAFTDVFSHAYPFRQGMVGEGAATVDG